MSRREKQDELDDALRSVFADRDLEPCVEELTTAGVPAASVCDPRTLVQHPQFVSRGFFDEVDHSVVGRQATMSAPFRFTSVEHWLTRSGPTLGEHNAEVLRELGYDDEAIEALVAKKVIGDWPEGL